MARFIHSILAPNQVVTADGDQTFDLPVLPLSVILLHATPLGETSTITTHRLVRGLLEAFTTIRVTHKGTSVFDASGLDAGILAMVYHRVAIWQANAVETDDDRRSLVLPILFGRRPYLPSECFPQTRKGEFQLTVTFNIAGTGFDGLRISIETIELPGVTPEFVQKVTTLAQTLAATGQNDIELPIGNVLRGCLLFGTTGFLGATPVPTLGQLSLFVDNAQRLYSASDFEVLRSVMGLRGVSFPPDGRHIHSLNGDVTSPVATDLATVIVLANEIRADLNAGIDVLEPEVGGSLDASYVLMDFDPRTRSRNPSRKHRTIT